ncbi:hypothetical protein VIN01S_35080 [Vibrio inusitatus NBRC 102082]|uniref:Uncharacterized protein n=1 Tax=Vibrio inusitatus NBRC 102082 TaxID=1219070 RepID=A0A4Y3I2N2_9VIBR|nr:hypothetical protein [Vibrio inusitatus]GEA52704.1 hypothetical protein VIN01S_35080 [Vibrio inusitatus NBRC 102082]
MLELSVQETKAFTKGLSYELMFRKLARQVFTELEQNPSGEMKSESIALLNRIENHNSLVMNPVREQFGVDTRIGCGDKAFATTVTWVLKVMPSLGFQYLEGSARRFVVQLEDIASISPPVYEKEMNYMVEHERALYRYLVEFNDGNYSKADSVFEDFIEQYHIK